MCINEGNSYVTMLNSTISSNDAVYGGGIALTSNNTGTAIAGSSFVGNSATESGGTV